MNDKIEGIIDTTCKTCRLCLDFTPNSLEIFSGTINGNLKIASLISQHFWFTPDESDPYSNYICNLCLNNTLNFHKFYEQIKIAQTQLMKVFNQLYSVSENSRKHDENDEENVDNDCCITAISDNNSDHDQESPLLLSSTLPPPPALPESTKKKETICNSKQKQVPLHQPTKKKNSKPIQKTRKSNRSDISDEMLLKYFDLTCDQCLTKDNEQLKFTSATANRQHYKSVHKMFNRCNGNCRICSIHQTSASKMQEHIRWHQNPSDYQCRICSKQFQFSYVLRSHELSHESDTISTKYFICDICGLKALTLSGLKVHMNQRHSGSERSQRLVTTKTLTGSSTIKQLYPCSHCDKVFSNRDYHKMHIRKVHQKSFSIICDICGHGVYNKTELRTHHFNRHTAIEDKPKLQCDICGAWFTAKDLLQRHKRSVHLEGKLPCPHCNMKIKSRAGLCYHIRLVHDNRKKFKCVECSEAYSKNYQLQEHIAAVHTGELLYRCEYCSESFSRSWKRYHHQKNVHSDEYQKKKEKQAIERIILKPENSSTVFPSS